MGHSFPVRQIPRLSPWGVGKVCWEGLRILVNSARHEEDYPTISWTVEDARTCVLLTAVISEYVAKLERSGAKT